MAHRVQVFFAALLALSLFPDPHILEAQTVRSIIFPVIGQASYRDDFGDPRAGHAHEGNDIFGSKMMPLIAATDGVVSFVAFPQPDWGYSVTIRDAEGYQYRYLHINNDTPGTDDGRGSPMFAYAPYMQSGNPVVRGQLIGWMGDSGNAEGTRPHLHFEIRMPDGTPFSPYESLRSAARLTAPIHPPALPGETLPYGNLTIGTTVAAGNFDHDSATEFVTGAGPGGGPHVRTFDSAPAASAGIAVGETSAATIPAQSLAIPAPSGIEVGDFLVAVISVRATPSVTPPAGWTLIRFDVNGNLMEQGVYYKIVSSGEPFSYNWIFSSPQAAAGGIAAYRGIKNVAPIQAHDVMTGSERTTSLRASSVTISARAIVLTFFGSDESTRFSPPSGMRELWDDYADSGDEEMSSMGAEVIQNTSGTTGGKLATAREPGAYIAHTIALTLEENTSPTSGNTASFYAYVSGFLGGTDVAAGDIDGDGVDEIITAPGPGGGPHVRIFKADGTPVGNGFMAYSPQFQGGVSVAAADIDGDSKAEIITAPGPGGGPHVRIFKADGTEIFGFFAYDPLFRGGVNVGAAATHDLYGRSSGLIVTGAGPGGGPHVKVFTPTGQMTTSFFPYDLEFRGGVRVSAGNVRTESSQAEIVTSPARDGGAHMKLFREDGEFLGEERMLEPWWIGSFDISAGKNSVFMSTGGSGRRASVWEVPL